MANMKAYAKYSLACVDLRGVFGQYEKMATQWDEVFAQSDPNRGKNQPVKQQLPDPMFTLEELTDEMKKVSGD
jgi:hypothetical protein